MITFPIAITLDVTLLRKDEENSGCVSFVLMQKRRNALVSFIIRLEI